MNFRYAILSLFLFAAIFSGSASAQSNSDTMLILPFENVSNKTEFNWVGESFADSLTDLLRVPTLNTISNEERKMFQQTLNVPLTKLPSLASSLRIAQAARANLLVTGKYEIIPAEGETAARIKVTTNIVRVDQGVLFKEVMSDKTEHTRDIVWEDALERLQNVQGQLAYLLLFKRNKSLEVSQNQMIDKAVSVPTKAFEAYIKGLLTPESDPRREAFLKNALRLYFEARSATYTDAALELGHIYLTKRDYPNAIEYFSRVNKPDKNNFKPEEFTQFQKQQAAYSEAAFYTGMLHWRQKNYEQSLAVLRPLADELKLINVYTTLGAIHTQASLAEKKDKGKSDAQLQQGIQVLESAAASPPESPLDRANLNFNHGYALFLNKNYDTAVKALLLVVARDQKDGESYFLLSKAFEKLNDATKAADAGEKAKLYLQANNRYAKLELEWKAGRIESISPRVIETQRNDFASSILSRSDKSAQAVVPADDVKGLLQQARDLFKAGRDDDALSVIVRILISNPMNPQAHLIRGNIRMRRGELEQAVADLRTALFWDYNILEAHLALGRIFYEKRDCQQAETYARSAAEILKVREEKILTGSQELYQQSAADLSKDKDEVVFLERLVEKCKK